MSQVDLGSVDDNGQERNFSADEIVSFLRAHAVAGDWITALAAIHFGASQQRIDDVLGPQGGSFNFHRDLAKKYGHLASPKIQDLILADLVKRGHVQWAEEFAKDVGRKLHTHEVLSIIKLFCTEKSKGRKSEYTEEKIVEFAGTYFRAVDMVGIRAEINAAEPKKGISEILAKPYTWGKHFIDYNPRM